MSKLAPPSGAIGKARRPPPEVPPCEAALALQRTCSAVALQRLLRTEAGRRVQRALKRLVATSAAEQLASAARAWVRRSGAPKPKGQAWRVQCAVGQFVRDCQHVLLGKETTIRAAHYLREFIQATETDDLRFTVAKFPAIASACLSVAIKVKHVGQEQEQHARTSLVGRALRRVRVRAEGEQRMSGASSREPRPLQTMPFAPAEADLWNAEMDLLKAIDWRTEPVLSTDLLAQLCQLFCYGRIEVATRLYDGALPALAATVGRFEREEQVAMSALVGHFTELGARLDRDVLLLLMKLCGYSDAQLATV